MKGDFSRVTFDAQQRFSRVLLQQGRVQLDADWNELVAILVQAQRDLARDLIGPWGGPPDLYWGPATETRHREVRYGFEIRPADQGPDFRIGPGRYYVDGILCQNGLAEPEPEPRWHSYRTQPHYPLAEDEPVPEEPFLVYLDVWERHVCFIDQPHIREVALNGPDTATRAQLVWQVKIWAPAPDENGMLGDVALTDLTTDDVYTVWPEFLDRIGETNRGRMSAWTEADAEDPSQPCLTPPGAGYRGLENQLYRVEIHHDGPAWDEQGATRKQAATFKWSRDNGSVVAEWLGNDGPALAVRGTRDQVRGFAAGQWVELVDEIQDLRGERGRMVRLERVEGDVLIVAQDQVGAAGWQSEFLHPRVRRWDQVRFNPQGGSPQTFEDGAILLREDIPIPLELGIWICFPPAAGNVAAHYRSGDYWLIPARTATADIEWLPPLKGVDDRSKAAVAVDPHGIRHYYAPLAVVVPDNRPVVDLRCKIGPIVSCTGIFQDPDNR